MGFEIIEADDDNKIETNHLSHADVPSTKIVTQDTISERTEKAFEYVKDDPEISLRTLAKALGCNKDTAKGYKESALDKINFNEEEKQKKEGDSQVSGADRQTANESLFNNVGI